LCDRLLERGVLVYDSTREQLAIELRERRGDQLQPDAEADAAPAAEAEAGVAKDVAEPATAGNGTSSSSTATAAPTPKEVLYTNGRIQPAASSSEPDDGVSALLKLAQQSPAAGNDVAKASADVDAAGGQLLWQLRWDAAPEAAHGPFPSATMLGWVQAGCICDDRQAEVRQCDANNVAAENCWHRWDKVDFELYL